MRTLLIKNRVAFFFLVLICLLISKERREDPGFCPYTKISTIKTLIYQVHTQFICSITRRLMQGYFFRWEANHYQMANFYQGKKYETSLYYWATWLHYDIIYMCRPNYERFFWVFPSLDIQKTHLGDLCMLGNRDTMKAKIPCFMALTFKNKTGQLIRY